MDHFDELLAQYETYCKYQKGLDEKTLKSYRTDLTQLHAFLIERNGDFTKSYLEGYCCMLHQAFKPKTAKRKIASAKAFFHWMEYEELIDRTPFAKIDTRFREPKLLPRTMSLKTAASIFDAAYQNLKEQRPESYGYRTATRDVAVLELLFSTGIRVSELSCLRENEIDLEEGSLRIYGKGDKERVLQLGNPNTLEALRRYKELYQSEIRAAGFFFVNGQHRRYSEQSVRHMVSKYAKLVGAPEHITPHVFRHTFATLLLESDVDIRYIQGLLGHSSIATTQIYTHISTRKQRDILTEKNPRNKVSSNFSDTKAK